MLPLVTTSMVSSPAVPEIARVSVSASAVDRVDAVADRVVEGVVAGAAAEGVIAAGAADDVGVEVADDGVVAGTAVHVLDVDQNVGADVDTFRVTDRRVLVVGRQGGAQQGTDRGSTERWPIKAVNGVEIDGDAVDRGRIADGIVAGAAVIDIVAAALAANDLVVAAAGLHDVVAAAGMDDVDAIAGDDKVSAGTGGDVSAARAGQSDRGRHVIRNCEVEIIVGIEHDVDLGRRRGVHERVAGLGPGAGQDGRSLVDEAVVAGGINQHKAAAAVLDELDAFNRICAAGAVGHSPAGRPGKGKGGECERRGVDGGVVAAAAGDRVVAAAAGELVVAGAADEGVAGAAADDVLDVRK